MKAPAYFSNNKRACNFAKKRKKLHVTGIEIEKKKNESSNFSSVTTTTTK